jgi:Tfp pilus assembly protein PilE
MKRSIDAFTLIEVLIIAAIIGILSSISIYFYKDAVNKAKSTEAVLNVNTISQAEHMKKAETDNYVAADNIEEINRYLNLNIVPKYYEYRVAGVTEDNFIVIAQRIGMDLETSTLPPELIVIAMDKSGVIHTGYEQYLDTGSTGTSGVITDSGGGIATGTSDAGEEIGGGSGAGTGGGTAGTDSGGGGSSDEGSDGGSGGGTVITTSARTYNSEISDALDLLQTSTVGLYYYNLIQEKSISVIYDDFSEYGLPSGVLAFWQGTDYNTIYINQTLQTQSPEAAIAAIICHEATHADYDYYPDKWTASTLSTHPELTESDLHITVYPYNSIDQEYNAFSNQINTWKELKGDGTDTNNDAWEAIYDQGEDYMKAAIRLAYAGQDLPEY